MTRTLNMRKQLAISLRYYYSSIEKPHKICRQPAVRPPLVYKPTWLTADSSHCLAALPAKDVYVQ